jgi:adenosylmethionine-8-amino-7-oxononanoate aminotransferase
MNEKTMSSLVERDRKVIWHPYSQHGLNRAILPVASAQGAYLKLSDGREILDAISSWWANIHGHSHPRIVKAIEKQSSTMEHVIFSGFTHEPAVQLAETLVQYPPLSKIGMSRVFYSDNGSTAVEVALKMAYQFHANRGHKGRKRFIALKNSYHGDTLGAMAVSEPEGFHTVFRPLMPAVDFIDVGNLDQLQQLLDQSPESHAAFIFEPLVQGAAGMQIYDASFLIDAVELCRSKGVLTIADEVFTGFFRTGKCFAFEHARIKPDLVCISKGITGGFLPLAVTLATEEIFEAFVSQEIRTAFLHGHTYTANPITCAAALESWEILQSSECRAKVELLTTLTQKHIEKFKDHSRVQSARCIGTIGAVELRADQMNYFSSKTSSIMDFALERNVLLRPLGSVVYAVPPYCCTEQEISRIYQVMGELLDHTF